MNQAKTITNVVPATSNRFIVLLSFVASATPALLIAPDAGRNDIRHRTLVLSKGTTLGYWAFWLQIGGMFGMTLAFATAGIGQVYLERIMGLGYLDAQLKIQIHFVMLTATASIFTIGVGVFIYDFFGYAPQFAVVSDAEPELRPLTAAASN